HRGPARGDRGGDRPRGVPGRGRGRRKGARGPPDPRRRNSSFRRSGRGRRVPRPEAGTVNHGGASVRHEAAMKLTADAIARAMGATILSSDGGGAPGGPAGVTVFSSFVI